LQAAELNRATGRMKASRAPARLHK
jgi:hypothetical protein